jgi:hypothetical protein
MSKTGERWTAGEATTALQTVALDCGAGEGEGSCSSGDAGEGSARERAVGGGGDAGERAAGGDGCAANCGARERKG